MKMTKTFVKDITLDSLNETEANSVNRILRTGAKAGLRRDSDRRAILKALRDSLGTMLDTLDNEEFAYDFFDAITKSATLANARKIASHPMCPEDIASAVGHRAEAAKAASASSPAGCQAGARHSCRSSPRHAKGATCRSRPFSLQHGFG